MGTRALDYDELQLGILHSFLALLPLLHSQLKLDGGEKRKDSTSESTLYQLLPVVEQDMNHGPLWILDKKIIRKEILKLRFKLRVSQSLYCCLGCKFGVFFYITPLDSGV